VVAVALGVWGRMGIRFGLVGMAVLVLVRQLLVLAFAVVGAVRVLGMGARGLLLMVRQRAVVALLLRGCRLMCPTRMGLRILVVVRVAVRRRVRGVMVVLAS
jgi:hypothetical protein